MTAFCCWSSCTERATVETPIGDLCHAHARTYAALTIDQIIETDHADCGDGCVFKLVAERWPT